jgi:hypothetical protein
MLYEECHICPITCEEIEEYAITMFGQVYEKSAIVEWLKNNETDPITGVILPLKELITKGVHTRNVSVLSSELRRKTGQLSPKVMISRSVAMQLGVMSVKRLQNIRHIKLLMEDPEVSAKFSAFNNRIMRVLLPRLTPINGMWRKTDFSSVVWNRSTTSEMYKHPPNTGRDFENMKFKQYTRLYGGHFKSSSFDGACLRNVTFVECCFTRCTFIGADLRTTIFRKCNFRGEEVDFRNALTNAFTLFNECEIEIPGSWISETICCSGICPNKILVDRNFTPAEIPPVPISPIEGVIEMVD